MKIEVDKSTGDLKFSVTDMTHREFILLRDYVVNGFPEQEPTEFKTMFTLASDMILDSITLDL